MDWYSNDGLNTKLPSNLNSLLKIVDGLFTSKIKYGMQLYGNVRRNEKDQINSDIQSIQKIQNKPVRLING